MCRLVPEATLLTKVWVSKAICRSVCPKWDDTSNSGGGDDAFLLILTCNKFSVLTTHQHSRWCFMLLPLTQQQSEGAVITPILQLRKLKLRKVSGAAA